MVGTTFYAVIEEIRENRLLVQGLEINDINGRGTFELAVGDKTELIWRGVPITVKDLIRKRLHREHGAAVFSEGRHGHAFPRLGDGGDIQHALVHAHPAHDLSLIHIYSAHRTERKNYPETPGPLIV